MKRLFVKYKLLNTLDEEIAAHIGLTQDRKWIQAPTRESTRECDNCFDAMRRTYVIK